MSAPFVVALDGPAASGKSTVGRAVAEQLGLGYFDTGLLYRALTCLALARGASPTDAGALTDLVPDLRVELAPDGRIMRDGRDITGQLQTPAVDAAVSAVSAHAAVRAALRDVQRSLVRAPGLVMAGRDIGTVIVPEAHLKVWLTASDAERARRRADQTGQPFATVLAGMQQRDLIDGSRAVAPMAPAADAVEVNSDALSPGAVVDQIVDLARARRAASTASP